VRLVDTHCHLDDPQFDADRDAVIERARAAGVERIFLIGVDSVGVHPHEASNASAEVFQSLQDALKRPDVLAIGEIGLDYHYNFSPPEVQQTVFVEQLRLGRESRKPVIIHTREAWGDTVALLRRHWDGPGIFHCFSEGPEEAAEALGMGFHLAFGGVITFPKADRVREAARSAPLDRVLLETDAPYLAPVPYRGKRNEPAYLAATARKLAGIRGQPEEEIAAATTANFERLFARP
jgi:TatD DNase family protein